MGGERRVRFWVVHRGHMVTRWSLLCLRPPPLAETSSKPSCCSMLTWNAAASRACLPAGLPFFPQSPTRLVTGFCPVSLPISHYTRPPGCDIAPMPPLHAVLLSLGWKEEGAWWHHLRASRVPHSWPVPVRCGVLGLQDGGGP